MTKKKLLSTLLTLIVAIILTYLTTPAENYTPPGEVLNASDDNSTDENKTYKVTKVIDGDTIEIEGGQKVRYIGMDTPESTIKHECFGEEASAKNKELVEGKSVKLIKDVSETDKYKRLLRYVYIDDIFVNEELVKTGYANAASYPPDIKHQDKFVEAEKQAREANLGLWESCEEDL
jgi:micrococcal nuclease